MDKMKGHFSLQIFIHWSISFYLHFAELNWYITGKISEIIREEVKGLSQNVTDEKLDCESQIKIVSDTCFECNRYHDFFFLTVDAINLVGTVWLLWLYTLLLACMLHVNISCMIFLKVNWRTAEDGRKDFGKYVINITHMHAYYERKL